MQAGMWRERDQRTAPQRGGPRQENSLRTAQEQNAASAGLEYNPPSRDVVQRLIHWLEESEA